jgi:hypothetical protein
MSVVYPINGNYGTDTSTSMSMSTGHTSNTSSNGSTWTTYPMTIITICFMLFLFWYFMIRQPEQIVSVSINEGSNVSTLSNVPLSGSAIPIILPSPTEANPIGCFVDKVGTDRAMSDFVFGTDKTYVTFEKCKQGAMDGLWKYFALQDLKVQPDGTYVGQCFVSNDNTKLQQYGRSTNCTPIVGTDKHAGKALSNYVYKLEDKATMPMTIKKVGCYNDADKRAMSDWVLGNTYSTFDECKQGALYKGLKYFGLQNHGINNGRPSGVCYGTNDEQAAKQYGISSNCSAIPGTDKFGGLGYANYVYEQS